MVSLSALWLPVVLSAVAVFLASSVIHMATKWHATDYRKLPDESGVRNALGPMAIPPGDYLMPCPESTDEVRTPAFQEKMVKGPVLVLTVRPSGPMTMGKNLVAWFGYSLVVSLFAGYLAGAALPAGAPYLSVFRFAGTVAFAGYALALWQMVIWYQRSTATTLRSTIDGLIYALLTAGFFGWLWPHG